MPTENTQELIPQKKPRVSVSIIVLAAITIFLLIFSILQISTVYFLRNELEAADKKIEQLADLKNKRNKEYSEIFNELQESSADLDFLRKRIAFIPDDGTNVYHTYDCPYMDFSYYWAHNVEWAESNGYVACPHCH